MQIAEIMDQLQVWGSEQTKKTFIRHGAREPLFGVKVGDLKKIVKKVKKNHQLALQLYDTNNADAMYLAGLIADEKQMSKADLQKWAVRAEWHMIGEYAVAGVAAESPHGLELAREWIRSPEEHIATTGWATLCGLLSLKDDAELDLIEIEGWLDEIKQRIHQAPNRVRYTMNQFVISVGTYIAPLASKAFAAAEQIGVVSVNVGDTACKVPFAPDYIQKIVSMDRVGKKRKTARC